MNFKVYKYRLPEKNKRLLVIALSIAGLVFFWPLLVFNLLRPKQIKRSKIERILIIRNDGIGDFILSLPALRVLRKVFPHAKVALLAPSWQKDLASAVQLFDEIMICYHNQGIYFASSLKPGAFFFSMIRQIRLLRRERFDLGIDIRGDFRNRIILFLSGIPIRIGFEIGGLECFLTHQIGYKEHSHEVDHFMNLIPFQEGSAMMADFSFSVPVGDVNAAKGFLESNNICVEKDVLVVVHPVCRWPAKEWPRVKFAGLCDRLIRNGIKVVLLGSVEDQDAIKGIGDLMKEKPVVSAGKLTLLQTVALIKTANVFIGNDAAPMHIAAAVKTPVVALFGPTDPEIYGPYGKGHTVIRKGNPPCMCTSQKVCYSKGNSCMDRISVDDVLLAARRYIKGAKVDGQVRQQWN